MSEINDYILLLTDVDPQEKDAKSFIKSYLLGVVWNYLKGGPLDGAHNSLVDEKAQTDIVLHTDFINYIDNTKSVRTIDSIIMKNQQK